LERLREAEVPCGPIYLIDEALREPQVMARQFIVTLDHPLAGLVRSLGFPAHMREGAITYRLPPPTLGEHTRAVLRELSYSSEEIVGLVSRGVV
jgi:crotonobetainyl-CoA:carnitine CoA-transferase CaiB-like acyl-CoA transferase